MKYILKDQLPDIGKAYTIAMILTVVILVMVSSFVSGILLIEAYADLILLLVLTYGQNNGWRYQKIHKKLRPFIMGRVLQVFASLVGAFLIIVTLYTAFTQKDVWVPSTVFILLVIGMVWQYYQIFRFAHRRKEADPGKCEFC